MLPPVPVAWRTRQPTKAGELRREDLEEGDVPLDGSVSVVAAGARNEGSGNEQGDKRDGGDCLHRAGTVAQARTEAVTPVTLLRRKEFS